MRLSVDNLGKVAVTVEENYWSLDKDYDKLTIVEQEGVFGTYISRKPVPAGTVLTDRKYWIPFSSLKEEIVLQFNEIVNELRELEVSVDEKEAEIYKAMASIVAGGVALKQSFGDSEEFGISQKVLTESRDDLQAQINAIVSGDADISLASSPSAVFVGETSNVTLTATSSVSTETKGTQPGIKIYREGEPIQNGSAASGKTKSVTIPESPSTPTTIHYSVDFMISGIKRSTTKNISTVYPIFYGALASYEVGSLTRLNIATTTARGTYTIGLDDTPKKIYFRVPKVNVTGISKVELLSDGNYSPVNGSVDASLGDADYNVWVSDDAYNVDNAGNRSFVVNR